MQPVAKLRKLYKDSTTPAYRPLFEHCRDRPTDRRETSVDRFVELLSEQGVTRRDVVGFFKELAALDIGTFFAGRHSKPSRLVWNKSLKSVGLVATGASEELLDFGVKAEEVKREGTTRVTMPEWRRWRFPLRPDLDIELNLPGDLTTREANRLAAYVGSLAIIIED